MQSTQNLIRPSGIERSFGENQIIVSKTAPRGRITYANQIFLRVARYSEEQVLGKPHSVNQNMHKAAASTQRVRTGVEAVSRSEVGGLLAEIR